MAIIRAFKALYWQLPLVIFKWAFFWGPFEDGFMTRNTLNSLALLLNAGLLRSLSALLTLHRTRLEL
jgi:hypothetical protein